MIDHLKELFRQASDEFKRQQISERELEHRLLELISDEIDNGEMDRGTWLKAFSESEGSNDKAQALYIRYRLQRLTDEIFDISNYSSNVKDIHTEIKAGHTEEFRSIKKPNEPQKNKRPWGLIILIVSLLIIAWTIFARSAL